MQDQRTLSYEIDAAWHIVAASGGLCRRLRCTESGLLGRDVRDMVPEEWRLDFRRYVARAFVGIGDPKATLPLVAPCGERGWFLHVVTPMIGEGRIRGYRATLTPRRGSIDPPRSNRGWWRWRPTPDHHVWDADVDPIPMAG